MRRRAIVRVMADASEQQRLRARLAERSALFSEEQFMSEMQAIVADFRE